jgi:hypothetical protein
MLQIILQTYCEVKAMKLLSKTHPQEKSAGRRIKACGHGGFHYGDFVMGAALLCILFLGFACEPPPAEPVDIKPTDICFHCKDPIADLVFAVEFITKDGFVRKFDDMSCLLAHAQKLGKDNIRAAFAKDIVTQKWVPAEQLYFVRSERIKTPKNGGIIAFQDAERAKKAASQYEAEMVRWDDLLK